MTKEFFDSLEDNLSKAEIGFKSYDKALDDVVCHLKDLSKSISVGVDKITILDIRVHCLMFYM